MSHQYPFGLRSGSPGLTIVALLWTAGLWTPAIMAEHEVDHRYTVSGYVRDADERALPSRTVAVDLEGKRMGSGTTDSRGFYSIRLHLHDNDLGKKLNVTTGTHRAEIAVTFTAGDKSTPRTHRVDFIGAKVSDGVAAEAGVGVPAAVYYVGAIVAVIVMISVLGKRRRKSVRTRRTASQGARPNPRKRPKRRAR